MVFPNDSARRRSWTGAALVAAAILGFAVLAAQAQGGFPFGRELIMDIDPIKGTKRVPTLDIDDNGLADLALWCVNVKARLIVVADTVTVLTGPKSERACPPGQERADEDILASLAQVTNWRVEESILVLSGGPVALRFRIQTN